MNWAELVKDIVVTALAAFGGAWAAFLFENRRERKKERDDQFRSIRFAHFVVMSQYSELITLRDSYLATTRNREHAWWELHPVTRAFASPSLNLSELAFVLDDLLNRLTVGQQRYETLRNIVAFRNQAHVELRRRAATLQAQGTAALDFSEEALGRALGNDVVRHLKDFTTALFRLCQIRS